MTKTVSLNNAPANGNDVVAVNAANQVTRTDKAVSTSPMNKLMDYVDYLYENYMTPWNNAVRKEAEYYKKVAGLEVAIANCIRSSKDKDAPIEVDCKVIYDSAKVIYDEYVIPPNTTAPKDCAFLYATAEVDEAGKDAAWADAVQWQKELGCPDGSIVGRTIVTEGEPTRYCYYVQVDRSPIKAIMDLFDPSAKGNASTQKFDPASYNQKDTAKTTQTQLVKDFMTLLQQQYSTRPLTTSNNVINMFSDCNRQLWDMLAKML